MGGLGVIRSPLPGASIFHTYKIRDRVDSRVQLVWRLRVMGYWCNTIYYLRSSQRLPCILIGCVFYLFSLCLQHVPQKQMTVFSFLLPRFLAIALVFLCMCQRTWSGRALEENEWQWTMNQPVIEFHLIRPREILFQATQLRLPSFPSTSFVVAPPSK